MWNRIGCPLGMAIVGVLGWSGPARACGGTFCDSGPSVMPVDQTGETVLFAIEDGHVEAHIQIQYEGDPDSFAWIVPVLALPEIEVGSQPLFDELLTATVPTFRLDRCSPSGAGGVGCGMALDSAAGDLADSEGFDGDDTDVLAHGTAGAYEYAVLQSTSAAEITQWLTDHGYANDLDATPILAQYVAGGFMFVAFRLRGGSSIDAIHPVVIRYPGDEPCVPIRLTRIAAVDDMGIRVFFLGAERFVPTNWRHVQLNMLKLDWTNVGANYRDAVTLAIDSTGADGHAFVTEYAGPADVVDENAIRDLQWSSAAFVEVAAVDVAHRLADQRLLSCTADRCDALHPLVGPLLEDFLPTPDGMTPQVFWAQLPELLDEEAVAGFSGAEFAAALEERIVGPAEHALELVRGADVLTRMFTTLSPAEMTIDPLFHAVAGLPEVSATLTATYEPDCEDPERVRLPDGREVWLDEDGRLPGFTELPWVDVVESFPLDGAPMTLVDARDDNAASLAAWNDSRDPRGCDCRVVRLRPDVLLFLGLFALGLRARRIRPARPRHRPTRSSPASRR